MQTTDISIWGMIIVYSLLLIPLIIFFKFKIPLIKNLSIAVFRMTVQLILVGLYLGYLFKLNNIYANIIWLFVMLYVANRHILKSSNVVIASVLPMSVLSTFISLAVVLTPFIVLVIKPMPLYDARYLIPVGGMILGNFLSVNIIAFTVYLANLKDNRQELENYLCMGATISEATLPFMRNAIKQAVTPTITTISTIGLVSLPGMMTGQLLGGSFPMTAIKYQIAIMIAILVAATLSVALNLLMTTGTLFDKRGNLNLKKCINC